VNLYAAISIAAIGIMIGMSMGGGAQVDSPVAAKRIADFDYAQLQAVQGHTFYRGEGQSALETDEERQHQLLTWLSDRYGKEIRIVDFSKLGYSNAGMTLVPSANNFSLLTIYENTQGQYLTLYIGLRGAENSGDFGCTSGARVSEDANSVCAWASDKLQFVVVSDLLLDETKQLAEWMKQNYSMAHLISSNEYFFSQTFGTTSA
jgi:anti-sigma factor RsiW